MTEINKEKKTDEKTEKGLGRKTTRKPKIDKIGKAETQKKDVKEDIKDSKNEAEEVNEIQDTVVEGTKTLIQKKDGFEKEAWKPKTSIGLSVKSGIIKEIDEILDNGYKILEPEIVDALLPNLTVDLLMVGQSKGKFGGGQKRVFKQTQKKTREGNKPKFLTFAVVGNEDGYIGIGSGKSKETVPAREKAIRKAKLSVIKVRRGCGDWRCGCGKPHTIPFSVTGKCGSVEIKIMPAPKGTGLKIETECGKILRLAGINDVWSITFGQTRSKINLFNACFAALRKLMEMKIAQNQLDSLNIVEGTANAK